MNTRLTPATESAAPVKPMPIHDAQHVDREHQVQLRLMQTLSQQIQTGVDHRETLDLLTDYTRAHFLSEELLMRQYAYGDYDEHVQDHERMLDWLLELTTLSEDKTSRKHAIDELMALFLRHIASRDRRLHDYLAEL